MAQYAIQAYNLGKSYRIGAPQEKYQTLRDSLVKAVKSPFQRVGQLLQGEAYGAADLTETIWALRDVSFDVRHGEVVGIIGHNGAGKSTLLKILSQITEPSEGEVHVYGDVGALLEVGTGFHQELTGRENIYLNGAILGMSRTDIARKFDEIVDFSGIDRFIDTPVKHYSSGMGLRLGFAVAAHLEPEILVVDEVLAVGDAEFQRKCLGKMDEVASQGRTVLFVSHNMGAIRKLCSRAVLLKHGCVEKIGQVDDVIEHYLSNLDYTEMATIVLPAGAPDALGHGKTLISYDQAGEAKNTFRLGEKWYLECEFEMKQAAQQVIAAIGIQTMDGVPVTTCYSEPANLQPGRYRFRFDVDIPFRSQLLKFAVGLSSHHTTFYYQNGVGQVNISEIAVGEQPHRLGARNLLITRQRPNIETA